MLLCLNPLKFKPFTAEVKSETRFGPGAEDQVLLKPCKI